MPEGMWFDQIVFRSQDASDNGAAPSGKAAGYFKVHTSIMFTFAGFVFAGDSNKEIQTVNDYVNALRANALISGKLRSIELKNIASQAVGTHQATAFTLECQ
jgi:hypothetical protein